LLIDAIKATIDFRTSALEVVSPPVEISYEGFCTVAYCANVVEAPVKSTTAAYLPEV